MDFEKALRMLGRLEALHSALSLSGWLMQVLRAVVQVSAPRCATRQGDFLGRAIAAKFVGDDWPGWTDQQMNNANNLQTAVAERLRVMSNSSENHSSSELSSYVPEKSCLRLLGYPR
jgi:hypothetical protein